MCSSNGLYNNLNPCKHLADYKLKNGYNLIQDSFRTTPYGKTTLKTSKSKVQRCNICSGSQGRFYMCLICSSVLCCVSPESNHAHLHSETETGHDIAVDLERAELYCSVCCDQVYDPDFDKAVMWRHVAGPENRAKRPRMSEFAAKRVKRRLWGRDHKSKSCFPLGLRGLNNLGNTCFMNSVLQVMLHAPPLRNYFLGDRHNREVCRKVSSDRLCLPCDIDLVFSAVFSGDRTPYSPAQFLYSWWQHSENLATYEQQDAHEFFISMLDRIHGIEGKESLATKDDGDCQCIAHRAFYGLLRSDVTCASCGFTSTTHDPCMDISLDLSASHKDLAKCKSSQPNESLLGCLDLFTRPEKLGSDQKLYCENCLEKHDALKQMSIKKLPLVLCFHIKRFEHSPTRRMLRKIDRHLQFPFSLDMEQYLSSSVVRKRYGNRIFSFDGDEQDRSTEYEIFAVVTHSGMLESGHYVTYLRLRNQWYKCDDAWITEVDEEVVRGSQCYLMYYVQKMLYHKGCDDLSCQPMSLRADTFVPIAGCC